MKVSQDEKQFKQLAGEFGVVSELCRRHIQASITYGTSKRADVVAISGDGGRAACVEVKSTNGKKWVIGDRITKAGAVARHIVWVFVRQPVPALPMSSGEHVAEPCEYFVLTSEEVHALYVANDQKYRADFRARNGEDYKNQGVATVTRDQVLPYKDRWHRVLEALAPV